MRTVGEAKAAQGYTTRSACCKNCQHFSCEIKLVESWRGEPYLTEKNKRCDIGGFAVQSSAHCTLYVRGK